MRKPITIGQVAIATAFIGVHVSIIALLILLEKSGEAKKEEWRRTYDENGKRRAGI